MDGFNFPKKQTFDVIDHGLPYWIKMEHQQMPLWQRKIVLEAIHLHILWFFFHLIFLQIRSTWKLMHEKGISPSSVTLGCMVEALVNCSVVEEAAKLVSRWCENFHGRGVG